MGSSAARERPERLDAYRGSFLRGWERSHHRVGLTILNQEKLRAKGCKVVEVLDPEVETPAKVRLGDRGI